MPRPRGDAHVPGVSFVPRETDYVTLLGYDGVANCMAKAKVRYVREYYRKQGASD